MLCGASLTSGGCHQEKGTCVRESSFLKGKTPHFWAIRTREARAEIRDGEKVRLTLGSPLTPSHGSVPCLASERLSPFRPVPWPSTGAEKRGLGGCPASTHEAAVPSSGKRVSARPFGFAPLSSEQVAHSVLRSSVSPDPSASRTGTRILLAVRQRCAVCRELRCDRGRRPAVSNIFLYT